MGVRGGTAELENTDEERQLACRTADDSSRQRGQERQRRTVRGVCERRRRAASSAAAWTDPHLVPHTRKRSSFIKPPPLACSLVHLLFLSLDLVT